MLGDTCKPVVLLTSVRCFCLAARTLPTAVVLPLALELLMTNTFVSNVSLSGNRIEFVESSSSCDC